MDYMPLFSETGLSVEFYILLGAMASIFMGLAWAMNGEEKKKGTGGKRMALSVIVACVLCGVSIVLAVVNGGERAAKLDASYQNVAEELSEHYGVSLSAEDVKNLDYPKSEPKGKVALGTAEVDGQFVTLVVDDGIARLYALGNELSPAE